MFQRFTGAVEGFKRTPIPSVPGTIYDEAFVDEGAVGKDAVERRIVDNVGSLYVQLRPERCVHVI